MVPVVFFVSVLWVVSASELRLKSGLSHPYKVDNEYPPFKGCGQKTEVPTTDGLPTYYIDLLRSPEHRWDEVITDKKTEILKLLNGIRNNTEKLFGKSVFRLIDSYLPLLTATLPNPYQEELEGISRAANITLGDVTLFNVFYEFFSLCTSVLAQDTDGTVHHARNLDFGLFLGWDPDTHNWLTTEHLKPLVVKVVFTRGNTSLYEAINFAGYIGILTGVKKGAFSLSIDERFILDGGYVGVAQWVLGKHSQKWMGFLTREVMESADNYQQAQKMLAKPGLVSPAYFILAGAQPKEGCIITRGRKKFDILTFEQASSWFLVQTNYDHWEEPPFYDNRRAPAQQCMREFGRAHIRTTMYSVLSTRPVLNKLTIYSALMNVQNGTAEAWLRFCDNPCWPW